MEPMVWFIPGGSSGFGSAIAEHVVDSGGKAAVTARDKQSLENIENRFGNQDLAEEMDMVRTDQVDAAVKSGAWALRPAKQLWTPLVARPSSQLVLGKDAVERMRAKLDTMSKQIADWENVSMMGTGFDAK